MAILQRLKQRIARKTWHEAMSTPVSQLMTAGVLCVSAGLGLDVLMSLLIEHHIGGAPVVDHSGSPVGMVSKTDLVTAMSEAPVPRVGCAVVRDIMMPLTFATDVDAPISQAAALMAYEGVHRLPVVARTGEVVGILTTLDIVRWMAERDGYHLPAPRAWT